MQVECDLIRAEYWIREDAASIVAVPLLARGSHPFLSPTIGVAGKTDKTGFNFCERQWLEGWSWTTTAGSTAVAGWSLLDPLRSPQLLQPLSECSGFCFEYKAAQKGISYGFSMGFSGGAITGRCWAPV